MKKVFHLGWCLILLGGWCSSLAAEIVDQVVVDVKSTKNWVTAMEKPKVTKLTIVTGPGQTKALQLLYKFEDNLWIALVKDKLAFPFEKGQAIRFIYKGSGAIANLRLKVYDTQNTAFGFTLPSGTATKGWHEVIAAQRDFQYLWGGTGGAGMDWRHIVKFEVTLDRDAIPGVKYVIDTNKPGRLAFTDFCILNSDQIFTPNPEALPKTKGRKTAEGYLIDSMDMSKNWVCLPDQGGKVTLSDTLREVGGNSVETVTAAYDFGGGGWAAVYRPANLDLSAMNILFFRYLGQGGNHRLTLKLVDGDKRVYGHTVTEATYTASQWQTAEIPKDSFAYLYGGPASSQPTPALNLCDIRKVEFTLEKSSDPNIQGTLYLSDLGYR